MLHLDEARSVVAWRRKGDEWILLKVNESTLTLNVYELILRADAARGRIDAMEETIKRHDRALEALL